MFAYIPHELSFIQTLLSYRVEALNPLFIVLNHFDSGPFYCLVGIFCFSCLTPKQGIRLFAVLSLVIFSNYFLKNFFEQPRPLILDPSLGLVQSNSQFGLPSGAAQAATVMAMSFMQYFKSHWVKVLGIAYIILICISRVYIGMHFISDVLVGCLIGFIMMKLFMRYGEYCFAKCTQFGLWPIYGLAGVSIAITFGIKIPPSYQMGIGVFLGCLAAEVILKQTPFLDMRLSIGLKLGHFLISLGVFSLLLYLHSQFGNVLVLKMFLLLNLLTLTTVMINKLSKRGQKETVRMPS